MEKDEPLTKENLAAALKEAGIPTKEDIRQILKDGLLDFWDQVLEPVIATKGDVKSIKQDYRELKSRLDRHHPTQ